MRVEATLTLSYKELAMTYRSIRTLALSLAALMALAGTSLAQLRSIESVTRRGLLIENASSSPVGIYWVNFRGQEEFYGKVPPGRHTELASYATHPFVFKIDGQVVKRHTVSARRHQRVKIDDPVSPYGQGARISLTNRAEFPVFVEITSAWTNKKSFKVLMVGESKLVRLMPGQCASIIAKGDTLHLPEHLNSGMKFFVRGDDFGARLVAIH